MNTTVYGTAAWSLRDHAQRWSAVMQLALQDIRASRGFGCLPAKSEERLLLAEEELGQAIKEIEQYAISLPRK
ncbi:MAG TPA: hypothetical protein PK671_05630 [Candidatus Obscuribacter sp.]|nr:hypothetical protein [Candidatus Obscuribacter sp.]